MSSKIRRKRSVTSSKKKTAKPRVSVAFSELAKKVLTESLGIKKGETVTIETWNNGLPFAREVVIAARRAGAIPLLILEDEKAYIDGVKNMPKDVLGKMGTHEHNLLSGTNAYVFIPGPPVGAYAPMITREENVAATAYNASWYEAAGKSKLRGVRLTFGYVGRDLAKLLGKSEEEIVNAQLKSCLVDFGAFVQKGREISSNLLDGNTATLAGSGDGALKFTLKGEVEIQDGVVDDQDVASGNGMGYLPPGMAVKDVDTSSATGTVRLSPSVSRLGIISDATLYFEGGKLTKWESSGKSKEKLDELLGSITPENRLLRALTIGFNPLMKYGYGQDRFVSGSVGLTGFGFNGIVRRADLSLNDKTIVEKGTLRI